MAGRLSLLCLLSILVAPAGGTVAAQDAKAVLHAVAKTIGAENLRCVTYSGSGYVGAVGQNYTPRDDWPRIQLASYTKTVNFETRSAREEQVRRQGTFPARGGGGIPIQGDVHQINMVSGSHAWSVQGANATPQPAAAALRQLDLWLTPPGFVKAAMTAADVHDEASTIITHRGNRDFYGQELFSLSAQRTLQPDRLSLYPPEEAAEGYRFETVVEKYTLSDGTRAMDVHHVQGLNHVEGMLIAYLPKEKIVIEADLYNAPPAGTPAAPPTPAARTFLNNVRRLKLDVSTIAPIHGPVTAWSDFVKAMGSD